jgi:hypothetical protein
MKRRRFLFVEPSKVGNQHITLIEGDLRAMAESAPLNQSCELLLCASRSTVESLSPAARAQIGYSLIPVMNPEKRRLIVKSLLEFAVVLRYVLGKRASDVLFVSCVLPTTLLMLEAVNSVLRRRGIFVSLHGEVDGLFDRTRQHMSSYGYWIVRWMRLRRPNSTLSLVVIDDFIKRKLVAAFPTKLNDENMFVVHHPITVASASQLPRFSARTVCFIGYKTRAKGFDRFLRLSELLPDISFLAIGGGKVEDVRSGSVLQIAGNESYLRKIAECSAAMFLYVSGYDYSLSAAAVDALSAGVHIIASDRPFFVSLKERFGADVVTICPTTEDAYALLSDPQWLEAMRAGQARRIDAVARSPYGLAAVGASFHALVLATADS